MKITVTKIVFLALTLILIPSTTTAKAPDGLTPAEETVCDMYTGQEYRLCNTYCAAMDCDNNPNASPNACTNLMDKFMGLTGGTPLLCYVPVTAAACPCFGDLSEEGFTQHTNCSTVDSGTVWDSSNGTFLRVQAIASPTFNVCMGLDDQLQFINPDEANTCVSMIEGFCALP